MRTQLLVGLLGAALLGSPGTRVFGRACDVIGRSIDVLPSTLCPSTGLAFLLPARPRGGDPCPLLASGSDSSDGEHERVVLRVYDIGGKYTPMMSALLRKPMPAIWHVGIGVFGKEYWFSTKIESKALSETETAFGMAPQQTHDLGRALVDLESFERHIEEVLVQEYNMDTYQGACVL